MNQTVPDYAVDIIDLCKTYADRRGSVTPPALDHVSLRVPVGAFFGLLGPNGAGKSTLINILAGLVNRTSGQVRIWGRDIDRDMRGVRRAIGVVPQELNIDPFFTPRELLDVQAGLYGVPKADRRTDDILAAVGLSRQADAYARRLSGGMHRRLLIAKAMVHAPPVLVLDEPTAGVDVELRRQLWQYVRELNGAGTTIVLTTHYLEEAQALCDRIAIIDHGRVIACESTGALLGRIDAKTMIVSVIPQIDVLPAGILSASMGSGVRLLAPGRLSIQYRPSQIDDGAVLAAIGDAGLRVVDVTTEEVDLEDIFLQLTARHDAEGSLAAVPAASA